MIAEVASNNFNPRSREGSDNHFELVDEKPFKFQSALPRGERRVKEGLTMAHMIFQSALPRGERRAGTQESQHHGDFNPRSREGSDAAENEDRTVLDIFQSALPRGERPGYGEHLINFLKFQSALPRGERLFLQ